MILLEKYDEAYSELEKIDNDHPEFSEDNQKWRDSFEKEIEKQKNKSDSDP